MRYRTKRKTGTYEHFCILILAQGSWKDKDRESVKDIAQNQRNKFREFDYHFYDRLTHRDSEPDNSLCTLCKKVYRIFTELSKSNDNILYQGHHYVEPENYSDLIEFAKILLDHEKVKKIFILDLDHLDEFKVDEINNLSFIELKSLISERNCNIQDFENIILTQNFKKRTLYGIIKASYY